MVPYIRWKMHQTYLTLVAQSGDPRGGLINCLPINQLELSAWSNSVFQSYRTFVTHQRDEKTDCYVAVQARALPPQYDRKIVYQKNITQCFPNVSIVSNVDVAL